MSSSYVGGDYTQKPQVLPPSADFPGLEGANPDLLPKRLYATDCYPPRGRINSYSKPEYILDLVKALEGTKELNYLLHSCFKTLFEIPLRVASLSGKLVHQMLCRSLHSEKRHELWFVFAGKPFRFSLQEFGIVTGLNCGDYPDKDTIVEWQTPKNPAKPYWYKLFGKDKPTVLISEIVSWLLKDRTLPEDKKMSSGKRLRLALIVIVEGILICTSGVVRASSEVVEMVKNLENFENYPWGRQSFELTLHWVKVSKKIKDVDELVRKFDQSHTSTHGFTLALQLFFCKTIPELESHLPDSTDQRILGDNSVIKVKKMKIFHNSNIMEVEYLPNVVIKAVLPPVDCLYDTVNNWDDEVEDASILYVERLIGSGYKFTKDLWTSGSSRWGVILPDSKQEKERFVPPQKEVEKERKDKKKKVEKKGKGKVGEERCSTTDNNKFRCDMADIKAMMETQFNVALTKLEAKFEEERKLIKEEVARESNAQTSGTAAGFTEPVGVTNLHHGESKEETYVEKEKTDVINLGSKHNYNTSGWREYGGVETRDSNAKTSGTAAGFTEPVGVTNLHHGESKEETYLEKERTDVINVGSKHNYNTSTWRDYGGVSNVIQQLQGDNANVEYGWMKRKKEVAEGNVFKERVDFLDISEDDESGSQEVSNKESESQDSSDDVHKNMLKVSSYNVHVQLDSVDKSAGQHDDLCGEKHYTMDHTDGPSHNHVPNETNDVWSDSRIHDEDEPMVDDSENMNNEHNEEVGRSSSVNLEDKMDVSTEDNDDPDDSNSEETLLARGAKDNSGCEKDLIAPLIGQTSTVVTVTQTNSDVANPTTEEVHTKISTKEPSGVLPLITRKRCIEEVQDITPLPDKRVRFPTRRYGHSSVSKGGPLLVSDVVRKKFLSKLRLSKKKDYIVDGHLVSKLFFSELHSPSQILANEHIDAALSFIWRRYGEELYRKRVAILDTWFIRCLCSDYPKFKKTKKKELWVWGSMAKSYVRGIVPARPNRLDWFENVDILYAPMLLGDGHWVGLSIDLLNFTITVMDPEGIDYGTKEMETHMLPIIEMLPHLIASHAKGSDNVQGDFHICMVDNISAFKRVADFGLVVVKLIELHAQGESLECISQLQVPQIRMKYALDIFEEFVEAI